MRIVLAAALPAICGVMFAAASTEAGSLVIPAWSFARGNARIETDPDGFADAGPVVASDVGQSRISTVEYDFHVPVDGKYLLYIRYAAAEARPIEVYFDSTNLGKACEGVTLGSTSPGQPDVFTWSSSGAKWEGVRNEWGKLIPLAITMGGHTIRLARRGPLPHLVALRLDTLETFSESWQPPRFKVRDLDRVPSAHRNAFLHSSDVDVAALRRPVEEVPRPKSAGTLEIPAWTFDRGNVRIYASPDHNADAGPLVGNDSEQIDTGMVEFDVDFPVTAEYTLDVKYAAAEARPVDVFLDGRNLGKCCFDVTYGSAPFEQPVRFSWNSSSAVKKWERLGGEGKPVKLSITDGKHTLRIARRGPLPHLVALRLESSTAFPKSWKQPQRGVRDLESVPVTHRSAFLPPDAVNVGALRLAIENVTAELGPRYPKGSEYLGRLAELEHKPPADEELKALRREALLAHPALTFDKLLFVKRTPFTFNTYQDSKANTEGGSLCVLSPVTPDGRVTSLVPELDGGIFSRFDISFEARKVAFGYKRKDAPFRIYEIDIDPHEGVMVPRSLRQLTFGSDEENEAIRCFAKQGERYDRGFDDMDPCYLPNGKIMFTSTRSMRNVFCNPSIVTTLHIMDADGKNIRCLSAGPLNEIDPCLLSDGRIVYTRWEYVDKGLGNGQSLWTVRPDGSGVDHLYKNTIIRPAQLLNAASIPGSQRIVTVGAPHCNGRLGGPVILVDTRETRRDPEAMTCITPEIAYPCMSPTARDMGYFREPYPFSEKLFLVSHRVGGKDQKHYGVYVLDRWGNRAELYRDPEISCFQPTPLRPRRRPTNIAGVEATDETGGRTATLFVQDVYEGMTGIERGRVKYLRVMAALPWPWQENGVFRIGLAGNVHRKKVYGIAKVHEDGSAHFTVPAEENVFLQALDENYMQLQHMSTFINLMPGEKRSCIGCHERRRKAPGAAHVRPLAFDHPVQTLAPQPGDTGPRMVHYASDVQPILDKHCVGCHSGESPKGSLDLAGDVTDTWNRSYENLFGKGLVSVRDCRYGRAGFRPQPPLSFGSHVSELVERIRSDPCQANLTRAEFIRIVTWIDANSPYYGTYRGKRDIKYKDEPDFRLPPLAGQSSVITDD